MAIASNASDIHLRSSKAMGLSARTPFSITAWIKADWNAGSARSMVGIYGPSTDTPLGPPQTAIQLGSYNGNGDLRCWTWGGGSMVNTAAGVMTPYSNIWVFIAYTFDGTNHRVYVNGSLNASATTVQAAGFLNQVYINGYPSGGSEEVGTYEVDQYALYRRTLSAGEIQTMNFAGGARHGIMKDLICRYEFDELAQGANTSSVIDMSGNGHTLTSVGVGTPMTYTYASTFANTNIRPVQ